ncbi:MAG: IclR family transcriptional regulator [candidate division NC10 bacterium]
MAQSVPVSRNTARLESPASRYSVRAVVKALRILETLGKNSAELSLVELTRHLNIEKSTLHRLLATLDGRGFVRKDPASLRYSLGIKMLELGTAVTARSALGRAAAPLLDRLAVRYRQTVNLAVLDGLEILYVAKRESPEPMRLTVEVGRRLPAHSTALGKAMLAFRPALEVRRLLSRKRKLQQYTPRTITSPRRLLHHLEEVRRAGFAVDREELTLGMRCLAAPVLDFTGCAIAAVSITAPAALLSEDRVAKLGPRLMAEVAEVSRALGGPGDPRAAVG